MHPRIYAHTKPKTHAAESKTPFHVESGAEEGDGEKR